MVAKRLSEVGDTEDDFEYLCRRCAVGVSGGDEILGNADEIATARAEAVAGLDVAADDLWDGAPCESCGDCWDSHHSRWA